MDMKDRILPLKFSRDDTMATIKIDCPRIIVGARRHLYWCRIKKVVLGV